MLIDTDVLIWATRGDRSARHLLDQVIDPSISIVTVIELMQGARNTAERRELERALAAWGATVISIDAAAGEVARELIRRYALANGLQLADAFVAASAITHELTLLSGNRKPFEGIDWLAFEAFVR